VQIGSPHTEAQIVLYGEGIKIGSAHAISRKFSGDNSFGFAMRMIAPTASSEEFGGERWSKNFVTSLELGVPVYREDNPVYVFKIEGRIAVLF
jgi:hypothetical protein